jgi:hypothetical protein
LASFTGHSLQSLYWSLSPELRVAGDKDRPGFIRQFYDQVL